MTEASELGLLQMGVAEVYKPATGEGLGYVYTTPDTGGTHASDEGCQFQRWLLFAETGNDFGVRPQAKVTCASLADWTALVRGAWKPGFRHVWARARIYTYGGTYGGQRWTSLPTRSGLLPLAQDPEVRGIDFQLDVTGGKTRAIEIQQERLQGIAYVNSGIGSSSTLEYWCMTPSFLPAGRACSVTIAPGTQSAESLDAYLALAAPTWAPGSSLSIVGCVTYTGDVPYRWL